MFSPRASVWLGLGLALVWLMGAKPSLACEPADPIPEEPVESVVSATSVQLNEILPAPSNGEEFIELEILDDGGGYLHGWSVQDASGKKFTFDQAVGETHADRFYVLYESESKLALNNTGDRVDLLNPNGEVVESVEFGEAIVDMSWSRFATGWDWSEMSAGEENRESAPEVEEPDEEEKEEEVSEEPLTDLKLNELFPNPEGDESTEEWIELANEGEEGTLAGWSLTDGTSTYVFEDQHLGAGEFMLVGIEDSGLNLNNSGDVIYLVGPTGEIAQGVEYGDAPSGESFSRYGETWAWTEDITPGEENGEPEVVKEDAEDEGGSGDEGSESEEEAEDDAGTAQASLAQVRGLEKGTAVTVVGVVGVEPGPLGTQVMYIQDETGGMQVYSYQKDFPAELMRGSFVSVSGITSSAYGEVRVNADEGGIIVLEQRDEVFPQAVTTLEVENVGQLVVIEGTVDSKTKSRIQLDSGIEVYIKSSTGISLSEVEVGGNARVVGVVNQYNDTLRLMPREQADLVSSVAEESQMVTAAAAAGTTQTLSSTNTSPTPDSISGWIVLSLAGAVILIGSIRSWLKKKRVAKRLFQPYTDDHESQRSSNSGRSLSVQLPPGTRS